MFGGFGVGVGLVPIADACLGEEPQIGRLACFSRPCQQEIFVRWDCVLFQGQGDGVVIARLDVDIMIVADNIFQRETGFEGNG
ncbi:hypothetical protein [Cohaesibacter celericrescens]|uniref:hypothetical protein n=1 Tax=Cohaesibacter celericrescens TaxID=2067669 RepID=UPI001FE2148B|nr:hypothetical protein [Cohaesibacter celericrescens]